VISVDVIVVTDTVSRLVALKEQWKPVCRCLSGLVFIMFTFCFSLWWFLHFLLLL